MRKISSVITLATMLICLGAGPAGQTSPPQTSAETRRAAANGDGSGDMSWMVATSSDGGSDCSAGDGGGGCDGGGGGGGD